MAQLRDISFYKAAILNELSIPGDTAFNDELEVAWEFAVLMHSEKSTISVAVQAAYVKRAVLDRMLALYAPQVDVVISSSPGGNVVTRNSDRFRHVAAMLEKATVALTNLLRARAGGGALGKITATAPLAAPVGSSLDANHQQYRGSAYYPLARRP